MMSSRIPGTSADRAASRSRAPEISACAAFRSAACRTARKLSALRLALVPEPGGPVLDLLLERPHLAFPVLILLLIILGQRPIALDALPAAGQRRAVELALQVREPGLLVFLVNRDLGLPALDGRV